MPHGFTYVELNVAPAKVANARAFYRALFEWGFDTLAAGDVPYVAFDVADGIAGGLTGTTLDGRAGWIPYVRVDDCHPSAESAIALGARILRPTRTIPSKGALTIIEDPVGGIVGLWQPFVPEPEPDLGPAK